MAQEKEIRWQTDTIDILLIIGTDEVVRLRSILPNNTSSRNSSSSSPPDCSIPLFGVRLIGEGTHKEKSSKTLVGSYASSRLKYKSHQEINDKGLKSLEVTASDETSHIIVTAHLSVFPGIPVLRSRTTIRNDSNQDIIVSQLSSLVIGGIADRSENWWHDYTLSTANNSWFREAQWQDHSLPSIGLDDFGVLELWGGDGGTLANFSVSNRGTFSTGTFLPMGLLKRNDQNETWLWQVENNGSWRWEIGDFHGGLYLAVGGPVSTEHDWRHKLAPGESFTSVPAAVCHLFGNPDSAFSALTEYRRRIRRKHDDNEQLSLIFNDYMNCLMGDPTEDKILALIDPVSKCGAEYFVIDAGWYADDNGWWDDVGLWEPSKVRFPSGFNKLLDTIRSKGMIPGVWVEPEVIGVRSKAADQLPSDAFFQEHGQRVVEKGRYQMDFRHPAVRERMDTIIDNLVLNYGIGFFKFDYNIEVMQGTDANAFSRGHGQLGHNRAYLDWVGKLYDRHPKLVIESCSSGAQRMDYAMLAVHSMQSTSDQQDAVLYAAIAAAVPTAVTPEQSATWAYPQPDWDDEKNALTVVNSLLGRVYLSGRLDLLSPHQLELISSGMEVYKSIRSDLKTGLPFWPLGLPKWHDDWLSLGITTSSGDHYLSVWRRGGSQTCNLPIPKLRGAQEVSVDLLYPVKFEADSQWDSSKTVLSVRLPPVVCGRLFRLHPH